MPHSTHPCGSLVSPFTGAQQRAWRRTRATAQQREEATGGILMF